METSKLKKFWAEFKAFSHAGQCAGYGGRCRDRLGIYSHRQLAGRGYHLPGHRTVFFNGDFSRVGHHHWGCDHWAGCVSECGHQLF